MTKALLTKQDVKQFIYDSVNFSETVAVKYIGKKELMEQFDISIFHFTEYIKMGMPGKKLRGRWKFDVAKVKRWLIEHRNT